MFLNTIEELEGGYVKAYAYDCSWEGAKKLDFETIRNNYNCDKRPF
jgi:hypothetical protein